MSCVLCFSVAVFVDVVVLVVVVVVICSLFLPPRPLLLSFATLRMYLHFLFVYENTTWWRSPIAAATAAAVHFPAVVALRACRP